MDEMQRWWEQCHNTPDSYYISDYGGPSLWERMRISKILDRGAPVLEIGVGGGRDIRHLHERGLEVHVVDIIPTAFERIKGCFERVWLESELELLPDSYFGLAISHLVTQHIDNRTLTRQVSHVLRALRPEGVFAMQFADGLPPVTKEHYYESLGAKQVGDVLRTPQMMKELVRQCGGRIAWISKPEPYPDNDKQWFHVHIRRGRKRWWNALFPDRRP